MWVIVLLKNLKFPSDSGREHGFLSRKMTISLLKRDRDPPKSHNGPHRKLLKVTIERPKVLGHCPQKHSNSHLIALKVTRTISVRSAKIRFSHRKKVGLDRREKLYECAVPSQWNRMMHIIWIWLPILYFEEWSVLNLQIFSVLRLLEHQGAGWRWQKYSHGV